MTRLMIVDDHAVVRAGLKCILEKEIPAITFGEAGDAASARAVFNQDHWDAVVLDLSLPGAGGLEILKEFRRTRPMTPVIILSFHAEDEYAVRALRAGACSYLVKECANAELTIAVRHALEGKRYIRPELAARISSRSATPAKTPHDLLSDREYLILCEIGSGKPLKQIAANLGLSIKTISTYRARLLRKMKMRSNVEVIRYVVENNLN